MKIECKQLLGILDRLSPVAKAIKIREHIPALLLHDNQLIAQSEDCYMSIPLDHDFDNIVIPFDKTYELLSRFNPQNEISLTQADNKVKVIAHIGRKKTSATIAALAEVGDEINYVDPAKLKGWNPVPSDFVDGLNFCKFSLPRESLNPVLLNYGISVDSDEDDDQDLDNAITTSDDFRISYYKIKHGWGPEKIPYESKKLLHYFKNDFVISANSGDLIIANKFDEYIPTKKYLNFRKGDVWARVILANIDYPKISNEMFEYNDHFKISKAALTKALERAAIFAEGESELDYVVNLQLRVVDRKKRFTIFAKNDFGKINETGIVKTTVEKDLSVNPVYMLQVLKNLSDSTIEIGIDEMDRLIFNEGSYSHILATYNE